MLRQRVKRKDICDSAHLVMAAVYRNLIPAMADRMKQGIFCNADSVTGDIIIKWLLVSDGKIPFCLGRDILIQVSAKACI